jgi:hypothetical protein
MLARTSLVDGESPLSCKQNVIVLCWEFFCSVLFYAVYFNTTVMARKLMGHSTIC